MLTLTLSLTVWTGNLNGAMWCPKAAQRRLGVKGDLVAKIRAAEEELLPEELEAVRLGQVESGALRHAPRLGLMRPLRPPRLHLSHTTESICTMLALTPVTYARQVTSAPTSAARCGARRPRCAASASNATSSSPSSRPARS